jgi:ABC-type amino acid transport substrate-binding protein
LDRWTREKKARFGIFASGSALAFKDPTTGNLNGYSVEVTELMMRDLGGIEIEWVDLPLSQMFAAVAAARIDMPGQGLTMLPSRALNGLFGGIPIYFEGVIPWLKPGSTVTRLEELNDPGKRIAVIAGSSQQFAAQNVFPRAQIAPFQQIGDSIAEAAVGRADAALMTDHAIAGFIGKYPNLRVFNGPPVYVDTNGYLGPRDDYRLQAWITSWARYRAGHNTFADLWQKWVGGRLRQAKLLMKLSVVGSGGEAVQVDMR